MDSQIRLYDDREPEQTDDTVTVSETMFNQLMDRLAELPSYVHGSSSFSDRRYAEKSKKLKKKLARLEKANRKY